MKKMFLLLLIGVFIISFTSAFEFDNTLRYEESDLKVTIENAFGLPLFGSDIGTIELKSHTSVNQMLKVASGKDRVVMYYDFDFNEVYTDGLGQIEFTDLKTKEKIDRNYHFVIWDIIIKERNNYSKVCNKLGNGTNFCENVFVGTYQEVTEGWVKFDTTDIPKGKVRIGLATDVEVGDTIDGVWTIAGKKITKHAVWTASLNVGLVSYYKLDDDAANTNVNDSINNNEGTASANTDTLHTAAGKVNGAFDFSTDYIDIGTSLLSGEAGLSISAWVKTDSLGAFRNIVRKTNNVNYNQAFRMTNANKFQTLLDADSTITLTGSTTTIGAGGWYFVVVTYNGSHVNLYVNGTADVAPTAMTGSLDINADTVYIGANQGAAEEYWDGVIDEVGIWNRSLSQAEITQLYNNGDGITWTDVFSDISVTLNAPVNDTLQSETLVEFNWTIIPTEINITNWTLTVWFSNNTIAHLHINDSINSNETLTVIHNDTLFFDDSYIWNVESCGTDGIAEVCDLSENRTFRIDTIPPVVNITFPTDNFVVTEAEQNITLNYTMEHDTPLANCFFNTTFNSTEVNISCTLNTSSLLYPNTNPDNLTIFVFGNDTAGNLGQDNVTIFKDTTPPQIDVESPVGLLNINSVGSNETLNVTSTDDGLDDCWYNYNGTNVTIIGCVNAIKNSTLFILEENNLNMTLYANDSFGNENNTIITWNYFVLINSQTFNSETNEGSTETFIINYTANETPTSINFVYNDSVTSADIDSSDFPIVIATEVIVIPNVAAISNLSFLWNIVSSSSNLNTSLTNQTVNVVSFDNCSVFTNVLFNYTIVDEATQQVLNGTAENTSLEIDISLFDSAKDISILNFSTSFNSTNPSAICSLTDLFNGSSFILDSTAKYSSSSRAIEYYNIRDSTIDDTSLIQNITLFDIKTSESTDFQITFKNSDFVIVDNALIQVNRQYVSEGVFKTVELPITDSNGQTVVHLVKNDIVYNYIVTKNNEVIGTFNNLIAFCDDETIGQCFILLNALEGTTSTFNPDVGSGISFLPLSFNTTTRDLSFTFTTNDGSVRTVLLNSTKMDQIGDTSVCSTSITSSSGTLVCSVPASIGNETIIVSVFVDGQLSFTSYFRADNDLKLGIAGYFLLLFMVVSLAFMFSESKSMIVAGIILGFVAGGMLFFIQSGIIAGGAAVMWLIIMGLIIIWKLNSEGQT